MDIITQPQTKQISGAAWLANVGSLSLVSPDVALNRPLADLVQPAIMAAGAKSDNTARAYQAGIGAFLQFLGADLADRVPADWLPLAEAITEQVSGRGGKRTYDKTVWIFRGPAAVLRFVSAATLDNYAAWLAAAGAGPATVTLRKGAAVVFLRVSLRENVLTLEQANNLGIKPYKAREKRTTQPTGRRLTPKEARALRETVRLAGRNEPKTARDLAMLDCMLFAGLRREEVATLTTGSLRQDSGRWWLHVIGKGKKPRNVKIQDPLYKSLSAWALLAGLTLGEGEEPLFCNLTKSGRPTGYNLTPSVIARIVGEYGSRAGLAPAKGENVLAPHDLRRTCAKTAHDNGASIAQVQHMLGHADPKTTMLYIGLQDNPDDTATDYVRY